MTCCIKLWKTLAMLMALCMFLGPTKTAGNSCSTVRDVRVVTGESAELYCHINNDRDDPSDSTLYRKEWEKMASDGNARVYLYLVNKNGILGDTPGTGYEGRVARRGHDVVQLSKVTEQDGGTYRCGWDVEPGITGCAGVTATFTVTLIVPVSTVKAGVTSPKKEGESTEFTCSASGTSPITYTLHKVGGVTSGDRWRNASGVFTLSNIQRADAGQYRCTADNEAKRPQTSDAVTLEVYYAPSNLSLTSSPSELTQQENSQVTLTCAAIGGHPAPTISICREGVQTCNSGPTLPIKLTKSDNQVAFVCKATNGGIIGEMRSNKIKYNVIFSNPISVSIRQSPTSGVDVNTDVTLTCKTSSSSNPPVSLGWTRDGSTVIDGVTHDTEDGDHNAKVSTSQLRFRAQKQNNGNVYVCRVTTMTLLTDQTTLNVVFPPGDNIIQQSPPGSVAAGTRTSLSCTTDSANPDAEITWVRWDGQPVTGKVETSNPDGQYNAKKTISTITIATTKDHNGNDYACVVKYRNNEITNLKRTAKLDVTFPPEANSLQQSPLGSVAVGQVQTLTCVTDSANPTAEVTWMRGNTAATDHVVSKNPDGQYNAKTTSSTITIATTKRHNMEEYTCIVKYNNVETSNLKRTTKLNVTFPPESVSVSESPPGPVRFGTTKSLTCSTDSANPAAQITWTRDDVTATDTVTTDVTNGKYKAFILTSTISIITTPQHNEKVYRCKVNYKEINLPGLTKPFPINVTFPHNVSVNASVNPVVEGTDTTLTCQPSGGNPQTVTSYEWRGPSPIATTSAVIGSSAHLDLTKVNYKQAGKYICYATNMGGTGSGSGVLEVLYSAKLDPGFTHIHQKSAEYNQTVTFSLNIIANPLPTYNWSRSYNNITMPILAKSVVESKGLTSNLTIPMTTKHDMLSYICAVKNHVGLKKFIFELNPAAPPEQPSKLGVVYTTAVSVTVKWMAGFNGGFKQTFSVIYRVAAHPWPQTPQITGIADPGENRRAEYKVMNLQPNTTYEFRVRAENERTHGERMSAFTVIIQGSTEVEPVVAGNKLNVVRGTKSPFADASWLEPQGSYSDIKISVCEKPDGDCRHHEVNTSVSRTHTRIRNLDADQLYTYTLQLYDVGDLVYTSQAAHSSPPDSPPNNLALVGAIVGTLLAIIVIVIVAVVIIVYRRKHPGTPKKKDPSLVNNHHKKEHTEFHNNGFVNEGLEADIGLPIEDIDPGPTYAQVGQPKPKDNNNAAGEADLGLAPQGDIVDEPALEVALDAQNVGAIYAEVNKPKKKIENNVNATPQNVEQLYAEVDKKGKKKIMENATEDAAEAVSPLYAEVKKDKKGKKPDEKEVKSAEQGPVYAEVKKDKKNKKKEAEKEAQSAEPGPVFAEVKKDKKNKKKEVDKETKNNESGALYAEVKKEKKDKKKETGKPQHMEAAGPVYAEVKKDKKNKKKTESRSAVPVAPVYEEVSKKKEKDQKSADKSAKKGKDKATDKKQKKLNMDNTAAGAYENVQLGEPSRSGGAGGAGPSGAAADNVYQNFGEVQQDMDAENAYQNMEDLKNAAASPQHFEQIRGPDGTLYEDPRNLEFGKKPASGKPAIKPKPAQKPTEEPTEYAALVFTKKPPAPSGGRK